MYLLLSLMPMVFIKILKSTIYSSNNRIHQFNSTPQTYKKLQKVLRKVLQYFSKTGIGIGIAILFIRSIGIIIAILLKSIANNPVIN